jgi:hypothetical protein
MGDTYEVELMSEAEALGILGLAACPTDRDIKRAFRRLALKVRTVLL